MTPEFGAVRAHYRILNRTEADKAAEELVELDLIVGCPTAASIRANTSIYRLYTWSTIIWAGRG